MYEQKGTYNLETNYHDESDVCQGKIYREQLVLSKAHTRKHLFLIYDEI